jgi:ribonuclease HI
MGKIKYYVVWMGKKPGIYDSWEECKKQVAGEAGARYKSFNTREEAEAAYSEGPYSNDHPKESWEKRLQRLRSLPVQPVWKSISVDAACEGNPGRVEYQGVDTESGIVLFHQGPFKEGTNNIGEFLAIVHALSAMKREGSSLPVYSDSLTARKWVRDKAVKTKLIPTEKNKMLFSLLERALKWLKENEYPNQVLTWDTENWGEIPADFGRK